MTPKDVVEYFGGDPASIAETARSLNCTRQAIYLWIKAGKIPRRRQLDIQDLTNRELKADPRPKK